MPILRLPRSHKPISRENPADTLERFRDISLETALVEYGNAVYSAAILAEWFEDAGVAYGNGHHVAQDVAEYAKARLLEHWIDKDEIAAAGTSNPQLLAKTKHSEYPLF